MNFEKMFVNFRKKGYSGIIPFVYVGKEEMQYEVSMTAYVGKIANKGTITKFLPFKNYK